MITRFLQALRGLVQRPKLLQVGMVCLRQTPQGPEVLLVKTLDSGRWLIPKGWPMEGRSLAQAAEIEAWEEAGAKGRVHPQQVGVFHLTKRRQSGLEMPAEVIVFRMDDTELSEDYPEVGVRKRAFLPLKAAVERVDSPELSRLLATLRG